MKNLSVRVRLASDRARSHTRERGSEIEREQEKDREKLREVSEPPLPPLENAQILFAAHGVVLEKGTKKRKKIGREREKIKARMKEEVSDIEPDTEIARLGETELHIESKRWREPDCVCVCVCVPVCVCERD